MQVGMNRLWVRETNDKRLALEKQIVDILKKQQEHIKELIYAHKEKDKYIEILQNKNTVESSNNISSNNNNNNNVNNSLILEKIDVLENVLNEIKILCL